LIEAEVGALLPEPATRPHPVLNRHPERRRPAPNSRLRRRLASRSRRHGSRFRGPFAKGAGQDQSPGGQGLRDRPGTDLGTGRLEAQVLRGEAEALLASRPRK
jgi:hypothetical protein